MSRYQLIIFDWDGTLVDSVAAIVGCTRATLAELGQSEVPESDIRALIGLGIRETVEELCPGCDEALFRRVLDVYRRHWIGTYGHLSLLYPESERILDELERTGHLVAVATAKGRVGLERDLARTGLGDRFHTTRTVDEAPSKPSPEMLFQILDELGVRASEALMVGDTGHDLQMAANAGVDSAALATGCGVARQLDGHAPEICLDSVADLVEWLATLAPPAVAPGR